MQNRGKLKVGAGVAAALALLVTGAGLAFGARLFRRADTSVALRATGLSSGAGSRRGAVARERASIGRPAPNRPGPGGASTPTPVSTARPTSSHPASARPPSLASARTRARSEPPSVYEGVQPVIPAVPAGWSVSAVHLRWDGIDRFYLVARPTAPAPAQVVLPTVVILHGHYMTPAAMLTATHFPAVAGPAVLVYPAGYYQSWDAGYCCGVAARAGVNDVGFLEAVTRQVLATQPNTSSTQVYLAGYSNGGRMAFRLACQDRGAFAGVAAVEAVPVYDCPSTVPVRLLDIASTADPLLTVYNGYLPKHIDGHTEITVQQSMGQWRRLDGCAAAATTSRAGNFTISDWTRCSGGGRVELATYHGGSHAWVQGGSGTPSDTQLIWSFFRG